MYRERELELGGYARINAIPRYTNISSHNEGSSMEHFFVLD